MRRNNDKSIEKPAAPPPEHVLYDTPLTDPALDGLGRAPFAKSLADSIMKMDASETFVIGLQGAWGSGKSTVLNFVREYVKQAAEENPILVVNFNPWWFSGSDQLLAEFFQQSREQINKRDNRRKNLAGLAKGLDVFSTVLSAAEYIPAFGTGAKALKGVVAATSKVADSAAKAITQDANQAKEAIHKILRDQEARILVILDDLDRLRPEELLQIFQVVKAVADFPKTIYILSYERDAVIEAIGKAGVQAPDQYLEKIVQAPFDLPLPDRLDLWKLTHDHLNHVLPEYQQASWNGNRWKEVYLEGIEDLIRTPRNLKQLINALQFAYPPVRGHVDPVDFVAIHAVRLFAPSVHRFIVNNKDNIATNAIADLLDLKPNSPRYDVLEKRRQDELSKAPEIVRAPSDRILRSLFPAWNKLNNREDIEAPPDSAWEEHRICHQDVFDYYFRLSIPESGTSSLDVNATLSLATTPKKFRERLEQLSNAQANDGKTKLRKFLEHAPDRMNTVAGPLAEGVVAAIFSCGDHFCSKFEPWDMISHNNRHRFYLLAEEALRCMPPAADRVKLITYAFRNGDAICLMVRSLARWREPAEPSKPFEEDELDEIQKIVLEKIEIAAKNDTLRNAPFLLDVFVFLSSTGSQETANSYAKILADEDSGLADLLFAAIAGASITNNRQSYNFDQAFIDRYIGLPQEELRTRCQQWHASNPDWMNPDRRTAINAFLETQRDPRP